jgi:uncharacterized protein with PQ loop repeat
MDNMELWMLFVGFLMAAAEIPQIIKMYKRKSSGDISLFAWFLIYFGQVSWLRYGYDIESTALVFTNALNLVFSIIIMFMCVLYSEQYKKHKERKKILLTDRGFYNII